MKYHNFVSVGTLGNIAFHNQNIMDYDQRIIRISPNEDIWYGVDSGDATKLIKTTDSGATTWTLISDRATKIIAIYHDQVNEFLYCIEGNVTSYWLASGSFQVFTVDLSDDTVANLGASFGTTSDQFQDIFIMNSIIYVYYAIDSSQIFKIRKVSDGTEYTVFDGSASPLGGQQGCVYNDSVYFCTTNFVAGPCKLYSFNGSTVTERFDFVGLSSIRFTFDSMLSRNRWFLENNFLYIPVHAGTNVTEWWKYNVAIYLMEGEAYTYVDDGTYHPKNLSQRQRYNLNLPVKFMFIKSDFTGLPEAKIWDNINLEFDYYSEIYKTNYIIWSNDRYIVDEDYVIWEYKESTNELYGVKISREIEQSSLCNIETRLIFNADQKITLKDNYGNFIFIGNVFNKAYSGNLREYEIRCLDKEVYNNKFTQSYSAKTAKYIMEHIIDNYANWLSYVGGSIDTAFTATYTLDFKNVPIYEAFDMLMDYEDGTWYANPEGVVYARKVANIIHGYTSGHFIGEFSFTEEEDWEEGINIGFIDGDSSSGLSKVFIKPTMDKHHKVLDCHHTISGGVNVYHSHAGQGYGTHEFLFRVSLDDVQTQILLKDGASASFGFGTSMITSGRFSYYGNGGWFDLGTLDVVADTWYDIRIDFETTGGSFQGLGVNYFHIYVNGVHYGDYLGVNWANIDRLYFVTPSQTENFHMYIDSVDHSWSSGYYAGRNQEDWIDITENTHQIVGDVKLKEALTKYNKVTIYGGISGTARLKAEANDSAHQTEFGVQEYVDHFPRVLNQTDLDTLATAILNRTGLSNYPKTLTLTLTDVGYLQVGTLIDLRFNLYDELNTIETYHVLASDYDPIADLGKYTISTGLIQEGREYRVDIHKTSNADEEQIDILAAASGGAGEPNTMSSEGSGISIYYQKDGINLELNAIKSENNRITISLDAITHDVEVTLNEGNIVHANISGGTADDAHHNKVHNNTEHSTDYEPEITPKLTAFNKDFGTGSTEVCVGNDSRLSDARTPTQHNNDYHSTDYEAAFSKYTAFNKDFSATAEADHVCEANDSRLSNARTPIVHNNTYHNPNFVAADGTVPLTAHWDAGNFDITASKFKIRDDGNDEGFMGAAGGWGLHHPTTSQGGYDAVEITIDDPFQVRFGSSLIFQIATNGVINTYGTVAMNSHKITELTNGESAQDAMAYGQKYTNANAVSAVQTAGLTMTAGINMQGNNIVMSGGATVDGKDVSDLTTNASVANSISTHAALSSVHHGIYTNGMAVSAVQTADDYVKNDAASETMDGGTNTTLNLISNDDGESVIQLYGASQGSGRLFVGQSLSHGGGIEYNGDNVPAYSGAGADMIALYRVSSSVPYWTARNFHNSNDWEFRGGLTVGENIVMNAGATVDGKDVSDLTTNASVANSIATHDALESTHHEKVMQSDLHPQNHNNDYHTTNYEVYNANIQGHVANPSSIPSSHHTKYSNANALTAVGMSSGRTFNGAMSMGGYGITAAATILCTANVNSGMVYTLSSTDHRSHGETLLITTNGGGFGSPMYSDASNNRVSVCVDTSITTMPCIGVWLQSGMILLKGVIRDNSWGFDVGKPVYVNGSVFSTDPPLSVGDIVQVVGVSLEDDVMIFNPSLAWVVRK